MATPSPLPVLNLDMAVDAEGRVTKLSAGLAAHLAMI